MSDRTCTNCQATIVDGAHFCTTCGAAAPADVGADPTTVMDPAPPEWAPPQASSSPPAPPPPAAPSWPASSAPVVSDPGAVWQAGLAPAAPAAPTAPTPSAPLPPPQQTQPQYAPQGAPPEPAPPAWSQPQSPSPQAWPPPGGSAPQGASAPWQQPTAAPPTQAYGQPAVPYGAASYTTAKKKSNAFGAITAFLGAILLVIGAFTPWVRTVVDSGISGWTVSDDAKVIVALAVVALLVGIAVMAGVRNVLLKLVLVGLGIAVIAFAVVDILSVGSDLPDSLNAQIGVGLILVPIGGVVLLVSGLVTRSAK